jgi:hypothetical protein
MGEGWYSAVNPSLAKVTPRTHRFSPDQLLLLIAPVEKKKIHFLGLRNLPFFSLLPCQPTFDLKLQAIKDQLSLTTGFYRLFFL